MHEWWVEQLNHMIDTQQVNDVAVFGVDETTARTLLRAIGRPRWNVRVVHRQAEAEHAAASGRAGALVLGQGHVSVEELRRLSRAHPTVACIIWSSSLTSDAIAQLLTAGASDVLTARMGDAELSARIERALRGAAGNRAEQARIGALEVDAFRGEASWHGQRLPLTNRERDVLEVLVHEQGRTLRRDVIFQRIWGHAMPAGDRNVDVNVKRLRAKLATATDQQVSIETINRVGYRVRIEPASAEAASGSAHE